MIVYGLDLRHLEIFARVVQEGGITPAAKSLGLTQPTVSGHIQSLERETGTVLLHRGGGRARPTAAGELLYGFAKTICEKKGEALAALENLLGLRQGELRLGASTTPATYFLPPYLWRFKAEHPAVHIELITGDTREMLQALDDGAVELALVGDEVDEDRYRAHKVADDLIVLAVGSTHPWFGRAKVAAADLKGQPLVVRGEGSATLSAIDHALAAAGLQIGREVTIALRLPTNEAIREAVAHSKAVAFLPRICLKGRENALHAVQVEGLSIVRAFTLVQTLTRELSPAAKSFLTLFAPLPGTPKTRRK